MTEETNNNNNTSSNNLYNKYLNALHRLMNARENSSTFPSFSPPSSDIAGGVITGGAAPITYDPYGAYTNSPINLRQGLQAINNFVQDTRNNYNNLRNQQSYEQQVNPINRLVNSAAQNIYSTADILTDPSKIEQSIRNTGKAIVNKANQYSKDPNSIKGDIKQGVEATKRYFTELDPNQNVLLPLEVAGGLAGATSLIKGAPKVTSKPIIKPQIPSIQNGVSSRNITSRPIPTNFEDLPKRNVQVPKEDISNLKSLEQLQLNKDELDFRRNSALKQETLDSAILKSRINPNESVWYELDDLIRSKKRDDLRMTSGNALNNVMSEYLMSDNPNMSNIARTYFKTANTDMLNQLTFQRAIELYNINNPTNPLQNFEIDKLAGSPYMQAARIEIGNKLYGYEPSITQGGRLPSVYEYLDMEGFR